MSQIHLILTMISNTNLTRRNRIIIICVITLSKTLHSSSCPKDEHSWNRQEAAFACKPLAYHCGITVHGKEMEFCAPSMFMKKGICPLFDINGDGNVVEQECVDREGCPLEGYLTNELYKYPSCLNISFEYSRSWTPTINITESVVTAEYDKLIFTDGYYGETSMTSKSTRINLNGDFTRNVYSTFPHTDIHFERLISVCTISGTSVVINVLIAIYLIIYNTCVRRFERRQDTRRELEQNVTVTAVEKEEENEYCEVSDVDLPERHDRDNGTIPQDCNEDKIKSKDSFNDDENEMRPVIDKSKKGNDDKQNDSNVGDESGNGGCFVYKELAGRNMYSQGNFVGTTNVCKVHKLIEMEIVNIGGEAKSNGNNDDDAYTK